jgi:hypothetical protein
MKPKYQIFLKSTMVMLAFVLLFTVSTTVSANTTYMYTGAEFTEKPTTPLLTQITGFLTFSDPILPSSTYFYSYMDNYDPTLVDWSFTDGFKTYDSVIPPYRYVSLGTDSEGNIIQWDIKFTVQIGPNNYANMEATSNFMNPGYDQAWGTLYQGMGNPSLPYLAYTSEKGSWSRVPEPSTVLFIVSGLVGLLGLKVRLKS